MAATVTVRRSADRFLTRTPWLQSRHLFSFGPHYDPANTGFGSLLVLNDDLVAPETGFDTHPHRDMEIITWVLSGSLVHQDSAGNAGLIYPGLAQRMRAGTGILHSERNDSWRSGDGAVTAPSEPVRFVQMWVRPDAAGLVPGYQQREVGADLSSGELVTVASGRAGEGAALEIATAGARFQVAQLGPGQQVLLPEAASVQVYVAEGSAVVEAVGDLAAGDAAQLHQAGARRVQASAEGAHVLVWSFEPTT